MNTFKLLLLMTLFFGCSQPIKKEPIRKSNSLIFPKRKSSEVKWNLEIGDSIQSDIKVIH